MHWKPFETADLRTLTLQEHQAYVADMINPEYGDWLADAGPALTAVQDGKTVFCGGIFTIWEGRAQIWALVSAEAGRHFIGIFRMMRRFIDLHETKRIEATVDSDFEQGHRLIQMLGFVREGRMRSYQDGRDCDLYARVK